MSDAPRIVVRPRSVISPEEARDARARAWAFVFSCWHAKRVDGSATTPRQPKGENNKEVSYVDHFSVEPSNIVDPQLIKEKE